MAITNNEIELLKTKTSIKDFNNVKKNEFEGLQKMLANKALSTNEVSTLVELIPNFVELQKDLINGLKVIAENSGNSQKTALDVINNQMKILEKLATCMQSDDARLKIAKDLMKLSEETNRIIERMNSNNNDFWKWITSGATTIAAIIGVVILNNKK
ncbi:hypothetical protein [Haemophilus parainfluenzae]|jgi:hypothetical protein|uniref:hypothetical protein n=1 Tax=Haemophilus parainfluenzae TaxID=729 RepID=UPI002240D16F|nr:hypothetical protein [Haemophilus parainfluenzae]